MKNLIVILIICIGIFSCKTTDKISNTDNEVVKEVANDTVRIGNEESNYQIIIIEPGFNAWLDSTARPEGYYSQQFMENRNHLYVVSWNQRVLDPYKYDPNLYQMRIDYNPNIDYGYEVNYKLYNYFIYFQLQYKQRLTGFTPRI